MLDVAELAGALKAELFLGRSEELQVLGSLSSEEVKHVSPELGCVGGRKREVSIWTGAEMAPYLLKSLSEAL